MPVAMRLIFSMMAQAFHGGTHAVPVGQVETSMPDSDIVGTAGNIGIRSRR